MTEITVVMATRNAAWYVAEALSSVTDQAATAAMQVVVIDADSTDGTPDIVRRVPGVRLERQTGSGLWQAWNQAIAAARTPFIAMLDSDDTWEPGSLAAHLRAFASEPAAMASIGRTRFFLQGEVIPAGIRPEILTGSHRGAVPGATMYRREVFNALGLFPQDVPTASDVEWFLRLRQSDLVVAEPDEVVLAKRVHPDNLGGEFARGSQYDRDLIRIARESLLRRRAVTADQRPGIS